MDNKVKIFIVDDDVLYLNILKKHLMNMTFTDLQSFTNGTECVRNLKEQPDIVFLDYDLGDLSGFNVLKKIRELCPKTFTIIISGQEDVNIKINSFKLGAFAYIQKGINVSNRIRIVTDKIFDIGN